MTEFCEYTTAVVRLYQPSGTIVSPQWYDCTSAVELFRERTGGNDVVRTSSCFRVAVCEACFCSVGALFA